MAKLTKRDIVVAISNQTGMVQHQVFDVVQRTLDHITDSLASNVAVELRNFGIFQPRLTKPRVGGDPNQPRQSLGLELDQVSDRLLQTLEVDWLGQVFRKTRIPRLAHIVFHSKTA